MKISDRFVILKNTPGDINEHMETLKRYASECESVVEMGVRWGSSTVALLSGNPKKMTSYDIHITNEAEVIKREALEEGYDFSLITQDVLKVEIEECDLLFIDTLHTEDQLRKEMGLHSEKSRKYIILHDTTTFGNVGQIPGSGGLLPVVGEMVDTGKWRIKEVFNNNNGLTVLERTSKSD